MSFLKCPAFFIVAHEEDAISFLAAFPKTSKYWYKKILELMNEITSTTKSAYGKVGILNVIEQRPIKDLSHRKQILSCNFSIITSPYRKVTIAITVICQNTI